MSGSGEDARAGLERIAAFYAELQATCPHTKGFWREGMTMCLECNARDAVAVSGSNARVVSEYPTGSAK